MTKTVHTDMRTLRRQARKLFAAFAQKIGENSPKYAKRLQKYMEPSNENLLALRKKLVEQIKKGMLERKDREMEIAFLAAMVWWQRLEKEQRDRIELDF